MNTLLIEPGYSIVPPSRKTPRYTPLHSNRVNSDARTRILYVDNDENLRGLGQTVLERQGYEVDTAGDGRKAFAALTEGQYHLLITDQNMPQLTGLELVGQMHEAGIRLPVLITSTFSDPSQLPAYIRPDITALLPKPFIVSELLAIVTQILNQKKASGRAELTLNSIVTNFSTTQSYRNWGINE